MCCEFHVDRAPKPLLQHCVNSCHNFIHNRICYFSTYALCESHKQLQELCMSNKLKQIERRSYGYPASQDQTHSCAFLSY